MMCCARSLCTVPPSDSIGARGAGGGSLGGGGGAEPPSTGGSGGGGNSAGYNCPRCAVPLTKFWQQDSPLWGCVDCREIFPNREGVGASRLPRGWTVDKVPVGGLPVAATPPAVVNGVEYRAKPPPMSRSTLDDDDDDDVEEEDDDDIEEEEEEGESPGAGL